MSQVGRPCKSLVGSKFGSWLVTERDFCSTGCGVYWTCVCDCGVERSVEASRLKSGKSKSCGHAKPTKKNDPVYRTWCAMRFRCNNKNASDYKYYGGKGVFVCQQWTRFDQFKKWADESGYANGLTIDRIDPNGNYTPDNCRWATRKEQSRNKTNNRLLTLWGESKTITEWAEDPRCLCKSRRSISDRLAGGWLLEESLTVPPLPRGLSRRDAKKIGLY